MKRFKINRTITAVFSIFLLFNFHTVSADDTCVFMVTADDVPPNIVILLDNGAEMEQIIRHPDYDSSIDYTPAVAIQTDIIENGAAGGNGFFNENGYSIDISGGKHYLVDIPDNLLVADFNFSADGRWRRSRPDLDNQRQNRDFAGRAFDDHRRWSQRQRIQFQIL